jgi:hypothetical protein
MEDRLRTSDVVAGSVGVQLSRQESLVWPIGQLICWSFSQSVVSLSDTQIRVEVAVCWPVYPSGKVQ